MLRPVSESRRAAPSRELLLLHHAFPGEYIVKAFGPLEASFRDAVREAATAVVGEARATAQERASRHNRRVCITLRLNAETVDEVIEVYERLYAVEGLLLIL
jgi:putative lipoic acid-binding regulatory protein